jgi:hypothetical protein
MADLAVDLRTKPHEMLVNVDIEINFLPFSSIRIFKNPAMVFRTSMASFLRYFPPPARSEEFFLAALLAFR